MSNLPILYYERSKPTKPRNQEQKNKRIAQREFFLADRSYEIAVPVYFGISFLGLTLQI